MELRPGTKISEPEMAAKLSISRTPVHDALRKLQAEGLVSIGLNRGASVMCFSDDEIKEIGTVRLAQDVLAAELASYYGSASDFERLSCMADACEIAASQGDIYGRIQKDVAFHVEISKISGNTRLMNQQYAIYQQIQLIQISKYTDIQHSLVEIRHHKPIISAIRGGDIKEARSLICQHVRDYYRIDPYLLRFYDYQTAED